MIYLLHLQRPLSPDSPARHYIGFCERNLAARYRQYKRGKGARFLEVARDRGIDFVLARVWSGERGDERKLKNRKYAPRLCPICQERAICVSDLEEMDIKDALSSHIAQEAAAVNGRSQC